MPRAKIGAGACVCSEKFRKFRGAQRWAAEVSLEGLAVVLVEEAVLLVGLDPLGNDMELEFFRNGDDGFDQHGVVGILLEVLGEGTVDFQLRKGEAFEVGE